MKKKRPIKNFPDSVDKEVGENASYEVKLAEWKRQRNRRKRGKPINPEKEEKKNGKK